MSTPETPLMRQYHGIKQQVPNTLLMFRLGDFYELFFDDAVTAARELEMSYRRAWLLVDTMNRCFKSPLVETTAGGKRGGGTRLTKLGEDVIQRYRRIERVAARAGAADLRALTRLIWQRAARRSRHYADRTKPL